MAPFTPAYIHLLEAGIIGERVDQAYTHLSLCDVCPRRCPVDRLAGELGACRTGALARVASYGPHMGEEDVLRGRRGSGTVFFARCNLVCQYCQNHEISQEDSGQEVRAEELAAIMLELQEQGCHNINLVSPSHVVPQILAAVSIAARAGLRLPLVYNSGGYDAVPILALLDGVIDIYMPDMKYADARTGRRFSRIANYPQVNRAAVIEMHRQVGKLQVDENGLAVRGLLVRHLVLPNGLAGTADVARFLAESVSPDTYVNIMDQYRPAYHAHHYAELTRRVSRSEYRLAVQQAIEAGLRRIEHS